MPKVRTQKTSKVKYLPYVRGFIPPTECDKKQAIGCDSNEAPEYSPSCDVNGFEFFKPIPQPTSEDDWLAQYSDKGQTYHEYAGRCPWLFSEQIDGLRFIQTGTNIREKYPEGKIYLLPIGTFNNKYFVNFNELAKFAEIYLGIPVQILPGVDLHVDTKQQSIEWIGNPLGSNENEQNTRQFQCKLEGRFHGQHKRYQIKISCLLSMLRLNIPNDALCLIGLTMSDLYKEDSDLFVAGWAAGLSRVAVFSFYRYDPSLTFSPGDWYIQRRNRQMTQRYIQQSIFRRSCKLLVHELGHLLGIGHCIFFECCMNGSGHLSEDFRQPLHLCPVDLHKLQTLVGFNILDRYKSLHEFYGKHGMKDEMKWISKRIEFIKNTPVEIN